MNTRSCWSTGIETEHQHVGREILVAGTGSESEQLFFVYGFVTNASQHRRFVYLVDRNCDRLKGIHRRRAIVSYSNRHVMGARTFRFRWRPGEDASRRMNTRSCWSTGIETEHQHVGREILVAGTGSESEQLSFIYGFVANVSQHRLMVDIDDCNCVVFDLTVGGVSVGYKTAIGANPNSHIGFACHSTGSSRRNRKVDIVLALNHGY